MGNRQTAADATTTAAKVRDAVLHRTHRLAMPGGCPPDPAAPTFCREIASSIAPPPGGTSIVVVPLFASDWPFVVTAMDAVTSHLHISTLADLDPRSGWSPQHLQHSLLPTTVVRGRRWWKYGGRPRDHGAVPMHTPYHEPAPPDLGGVCGVISCHGPGLGTLMGYVETCSCFDLQAYPQHPRDAETFPHTASMHELLWCDPIAINAAISELFGREYATVTVDATRAETVTGTGIPPQGRFGLRAVLRMETPPGAAVETVRAWVHDLWLELRLNPRWGEYHTILTPGAPDGAPLLNNSK